MNAITIMIQPVMITPFIKLSSHNSNNKFCEAKKENPCKNTDSLLVDATLRLYKYPELP